ncbi:diguanylate cyclase domain-containing protein [Pseudoduganella namucuonensis]|uniref:diguanylate cyclase n=1 Tax=Pseudoduganella namucuonensis TaxID=1035707 RepID=A0A1I7KNB1_9BURK|nr:diguanylate cyclase [Pseudoduganella namucuonensis]SFU98905.1 response regulator receiver modulated diguanylate cyclase [Pseudoduganella namucuonensis]
MRDQGRILFALDGKSGLELARRVRPQLILLDVEMRGMDGFAVCRRITADPDLQNSPVIFVTAQSGADSEIAGLAAGAVDFISKPLNASVVQARVRTHLRLQAALNRLQSQANRDGLTGLYNRRYFDHRYAEEFARHRRHGEALGVALIDVDHFKLYNDHYGHQLGDGCLQDVARTLETGTRRPDEVVARYGGEEFVVLLPHTGADELDQYGEWICQRVAELEIPHAASPSGPNVSISIGLSSMRPRDGGTLEQLLGLADQALYRAKAGGRGRHAVVLPEKADGREG